MLALLQSARPRQWVKNLFVAAPLVFSKHLSDGTQTAHAAAALGIFCALSSAVYLWNDIIDVDKDRAHPRKRLRPIPSGRLSLTAAKVAAAVLAAGGVALASLLSTPFAVIATGYLLLNVAYSLVLKRVVYVDVLVIAAGFLLRVVGGGQAIGVHVSPYLLACTALIACFLGFGKRAHELNSAGERAHEQRPVLRGYRPDILRAALWITAAATFATYVLYTLSAHTLAFFHTKRMIWSAPFAAFGLLRFVALVGSDPKGDSPTDEMLKDPPFMMNLAVWAVVVIFVIYIWR